tara:strand:- start:1167 stop:2144 length:978 start_codon:yes stop_codon:yes gene_type:complete
MEAALSLPATLVAKLIEDAERQGMSVDEYCRAILSESRARDRPSTQAAFANEPSLDDLKLEQLSVERLSQTAVGRAFESGALSGHINRLLPLKIGCRVLWSLLSADGAGPTIREFREEMWSRVGSLRDYLRMIDEDYARPRGDRLHASFPNSSDAAIKRFLNQYIIRKSGLNAEQSSGAMIDFGLIGISDTGRVQFTEVGRNFSLLSNPVLDEEDHRGPSLSADEQVLILSQIRTEMMREWKFMRHVLDGIHVGSNTPTSLLARINRRYGPGTKADWSASVMPHMRSGVLGRMQALGLVKRTFIENRVEYRVTPLALVILEADVV